MQVVEVTGRVQVNNLLIVSAIISMHKMYSVIYVYVIVELTLHTILNLFRWALTTLKKEMSN